MGRVRHREAATVWDTMPKPSKAVLMTTQASEQDLDNECTRRLMHEDKLRKELGPDEGNVLILEENLEMLIERLNAYQEYVEELESWNRRIQSKYCLVEKVSTSQKSSCSD
jgi:hypothetical protein